MLTGARDGNSKIELRGYDFSRKPDLHSGWYPPTIAWWPCGSDSTSQELGEFFEQFEPIKTTYASTSAHYYWGILKLDAGRLLFDSVYYLGSYRAGVNDNGERYNRTLSCIV